MSPALAALLALACAGEAPVPLPDKALQPATVDARMASDGRVRGYLARPAVRPDAAQAHPGVLVVVDTLDDEARTAARDRARAGAVVLVVDATQPVDRALGWLGGMSGVADTRCEGCPAPAASGEQP